MNRYKREGIAKIRTIRIPHSLHGVEESHAIAMEAAAHFRRMGFPVAARWSLSNARLCRTQGMRFVVQP